MMSIFPFFRIVLFALFVFPFTVRAELFNLSTGKIYEGLILREEENHFVISVDGSEVMIFKSAVLSINGVPYDPSAVAAPAVPAAPSTVEEAKIPAADSAATVPEEVPPVPAPAPPPARRVASLTFSVGADAAGDLPVTDEYAGFSEHRKAQALYDVRGAVLIKDRALLRGGSRRSVFGAPNQRGALDSVADLRWKYGRHEFAVRTDFLPALLDWDNGFLLFILSGEYQWSRETRAASLFLDGARYRSWPGRIFASLDEGRAVRTEDGYRFESLLQDHRITLCATPSANTELRLGYFIQNWERPVFAFEFFDTASGGQGVVQCFYNMDLQSRGFLVALSNREFVKKGPLLWNFAAEYRFSVFNEAATSFRIADTAVEPQSWSGRGMCAMRIPVNEFVFWEWEAEAAIVSFKYAHDKYYAHPLKPAGRPLLAGHFKKVIDDYIFMLRTGLVFRL